MSYSVSSAPCPPTETCPMRTCWMPCSGTVPVSSGLASDVQPAVRFFRQEEVWGSHSQRRVWTGGDPSKPCCIPHYSFPQLCPYPGQLKDEEPRGHSQPAHFLPPALVLKKRTFQDCWNMLSKPRQNCTLETHTDVRRHTQYATNSVLSSQTIRLTVCHSVSSCCLLLKTCK